MTAVCHFGFSNLELLTADWLWESQMYHRAKYHQNWSDGCGDMVIVRFLPCDSMLRLVYVVDVSVCVCVSVCHTPVFYQND